MTDISHMLTPEWAQKKDNEDLVLFKDWMPTDSGPQEIAWGPEGVHPAADDDVLPDEPEVQECGICEETRREGEAKLRAMNEEFEHRLDVTLSQFARTVEEISRTVDSSVVKLAKLLAERIIGETVTLDSTLTERNLAKALQLAGPLATVTLKVNQADIKRIREVAPVLAEEAAGAPVQVTVQADSEVDPGGVIVVYEAGLIDARFEHQLQSITAVVADMVEQGDGRMSTTIPPSDDDGGDA